MQLRYCSHYHPDRRPAWVFTGSNLIRCPICGVIARRIQAHETPTQRTFLGLPGN